MSANYGESQNKFLFSDSVQVLTSKNDVFVFYHETLYASSSGHTLVSNFYKSHARIFISPTF